MNWKEIVGGVNIGRRTKFHQAISLWCDGKINIGERCEFGFNYGGRFAFGMCELQTRTNDSVINIGNNVLTNNNHPEIKKYLLNELKNYAKNNEYEEIQTHITQIYGI